MNKFTCIAAILLVTLSFNNASAKIWRVNNTAGVAADFTDPQLAENAAAAGDTIHIEQSATSYGAINVTKQIVLIGDGYFLTTDSLLQANTNNSQVSSITFSSGSANSSMQGLYSSYTYVQDNHILIKRNYIGYYIYLYAGADYCTISGNYFYYYGFSVQSGPVANLYIGNNIFVGYTNISFPSTYTGTFENNVCYGGYGVTLYNFQVDNNIFQQVTFTPNNSVYFNNIGDGTQFGTANSNQQNVTMSNVFLLTGTEDARFQLKSGSPAIGAGYTGVDCGAFGGANPYKIGLIPSVPTIYKLSVPPVGTSNINVTLSTRSNN